MKKVLVFVCTIFFCVKSDTSIITYKLNGGRFGDNLLSYSKAKWISYKYHIPFFYHSFPYSDQLQISALEDEYTPSIESQYEEVLLLAKNQTPCIDVTKRCVYINQWYTKTEIDWNDRQFVSELKKTIAPLHDLELISPPKGFVSIALHIRTGGNYTPDAIWQHKCPLRFVPIEFYIEQLKHIVATLEGKKIYIYLFTDHSDPARLAQQCSNSLDNPNIIWEYRQAGNNHKSNVLEDFFSMMSFEYLIRPGSHFSRFVERLGDNKVVIFPSHVRTVGHRKHIIDEVTIKTRKECGGWKKQVVSFD